jgi:hypothetical protein
MKYDFFWVFPRRLSANSRRFGTLYRFHLQRQVKDLPLKMEPIQCSETSAISTETPGKHPKEIIFHLPSCFLTPFLYLFLICPYVIYCILGFGKIWWTEHSTKSLIMYIYIYIFNPCTGLGRPWEFQEVRHMKVVRLSALRTGRLLPPGNIPGIHLC